MKKTKCIAALLAIMMMIMMTACGGKDKNDKKESDNSVLTLQMRGNSSLNPLAAVHHSTRDIYSLCYEPLFTINDMVEPEGVLAEKVEISEDCTTAIVQLKDSVLWHNDRKLTADDVVYTINLLMNNPSWEYYECIKYVESAQSIDAYSLRIDLNRPYGQIAYSLTFPIVAAHNKELDSNIMGTGPYKVDDYVPDVSLSLVSNKSWHGGDQLCGKINVNIIKDVEAATTAFNTGMLSAVTDQSFDVENASLKADAKKTVYPSTEFEYIAVNHNRGIFTSQTIRSATSFAIDRTAIVQECYRGEAMEANAPVHPAARNIAESSILSQYSAANASEMLFLEGYKVDENTQLLQDEQGNTLSFTLLVNEENLSRMKTAELLTKQLFAVGIDVKVQTLPFEKYVEKITSGDYDAYIGGTRLCNLYDFEALLTEGGNLNNYGYKSENMNLALTAINTSPDQDSLSNAVFNFEEVFLREQPVLGLVFNNRALITADSVQGEFKPGINNPYRNVHEWTVRSNKK